MTQGSWCCRDTVVASNPDAPTPAGSTQPRGISASDGRLPTAGIPILPMRLKPTVPFTWLEIDSPPGAKCEVSWQYSATLAVVARLQKKARSGDNGLRDVQMNSATYTSLYMSSFCSRHVAIIAVCALKILEGSCATVRLLCPSSPHGMQVIMKPYLVWTEDRNGHGNPALSGAKVADQPPTSSPPLSSLEGGVNFRVYNGATSASASVSPFSQYTPGRVQRHVT